jgi:thioredoxin-like negative regulator of GroEL
MSPHAPICELDIAEALSARFALIEVWAPWCLYSRLLKPKTIELSTRWPGRVVVGRVDAGPNEPALRKLGIEFVPAVALLERGELLEKWYGDTPVKTIADVVSRHV